MYLKRPYLTVFSLCENFTVFFLKIQRCWIKRTMKVPVTAKHFNKYYQNYITPRKVILNVQQTSKYVQ